MFNAVSFVVVLELGYIPSEEPIIGDIGEGGVCVCVCVCVLFAVRDLLLSATAVFVGPCVPVSLTMPRDAVPARRC